MAAAILVLGGAAAPSVGWAAATLTTEPTSGILGATYDVGETFVAPTNGNNVLTNFSITLAGAGFGTPTYEVYIFGFNQTSGLVTTAALYDSLPRVAQPSMFATIPFVPVGNLTLQAGSTYLIAVRLQGETGYSNQTQLDFHYNDSTEHVGDPSFLRSNNNNAGPTYANGAWAGDPVVINGPGGQIGFTANFVPEPGTNALLGLGGGSLLLVAAANARRRRRLAGDVQGS